MNRHFFNFIAIFNWAAKTGRWNIKSPIRNKFIVTFLEFLLKEKLIEDFSFCNPLHAKMLAEERMIKLGKKNSSYYTPVEIRLKHELVKGIKTVSKPGKYISLSAQNLLTYATREAGASGVVICSSSKFKGLCTAKELIAAGEGGLVVCVVRITGDRKT